MPHFFIDSHTFNDNMIKISEKEVFNHIAKSLRAKSGEKILLIDENKIQYEGIIDSIEKNFISVKVLNKYKSQRELGFDLFLAQSPLRSEAQSLIIEKATELGVKGVYPVYTQNCALKKNVIEQKIPKWQKIMSEASKQCERAEIPTCFELTTLEDLLNEQNFDRTLVFLERNADYNLKKYLFEQPIKQKEKILVIIGPEGGFSQSEFEFFKKVNVVTLSLGDLILRAETAVICALGNIVL